MTLTYLNWAPVQQTSYLHLRASVTKQYNMVSLKGRSRSEDGKVAVVWWCTGHV